MIGTKHKEETSGSGLHNTLSAGTTVKGNINTESDFRLDGKVDGDINCTGKIVVGAKGYVTGNITAANAEIHGMVDGSIRVSGRLSLKASATIKGDIAIQLLEVEPNARFNGTCTMSDGNNKK